jgi:3-mercaptopyruvate sulfurtransferase SseA
MNAGKFKSFEEAREFARKLGLKSAVEWQQYCQSGVQPNDLPSAPNQVYKDGWKGWGDWLGT